MPTRALDLVALRLRNQKLSRPDGRTPAEIVGWLGAVQAQEYGPAKWALGLRGRRLTDADVEQAVTDGTILRTHVMRPTWHFVTPADIRWMQALTAPRVRAAMGLYDRKLEIDAKLYARSRALFEQALEGGTFLTRQELAAVLARAGITAQGQRLAHIVAGAELDAAICSGPRRGKQFTYALVAERAPDARTLTRDEALAELTARYFTSHGPALVKDFVWWSGLTVRDAKRGLELLGSRVTEETIGDLAFWHVPSRAAVPAVAPSAHLLPIYDEYGIAYKYREPMAMPPAKAGEKPPVHDAWANLLIVDGRFAGGWKRSLDTDPVQLDVVRYREFTKTDTRALQAAVERYREFLGADVALTTT